MALQLCWKIKSMVGVATGIGKKDRGQLQVVGALATCTKKSQPQLRLDDGLATGGKKSPAPVASRW